MDHANPYAPPRADVRDVADADAPLTPADRGIRLAAAVLDGVIMLALIYGPVLLAAVLAGAWVGINPSTDTAIATNVVVSTMGVAALGGFALWTWLTIRLVIANGQTIAKKLLSIRVVRSDGSPASLGRIFWLRNAATWLLSLVPLYGVVDALFIFGESRQCLHDKLADTIVIKA